MKLPDYSSYAGPDLALEPPFPFTNVMITSFPLRADVNTLQRFIDSYINIIPPEVGYFRVSLPYVYMMLLDYGKLANRSDNFGCFSQRELFFLVPLAWYKWVDYRWVFENWASTTPFIYVDGKLSLSLGRTAMGWPKSLVEITPQLTGWLKDPDGTTTDVCVNAKVFPRTYAGERMEEEHVVLVRSPMGSTLRVPPSAGSPAAPWNVAKRFGASVAEVWEDYFAILGTTGLLPPNSTTSLGNFARMFRRTWGDFGNSPFWDPNVALGAINLKQFRCADDPAVPCYQEVNRGPLRYTSFMRGGLLGNQWGDISGGYELDIACWPTFPVVEALGIQAHTESFGDGRKVARVKPVMPFWNQVNMEYERSETLALRGRDGRWLDADGHPIHSRHHRRSHYFNTTVGAASPVVTGPFRFQSAAMHVFALTAEREKLQRYLDEFINDPLRDGTDERFELWYDEHEHHHPEHHHAGHHHAGQHEHAHDEHGHHEHEHHAHARVYMVVGNWGDVTSETNSLGNWADKTVTFYIPIKRYHDGKPVERGLFPAYSFASSTIHACTWTELYGIRTVEANFVEGRSQPQDLERIKPFEVLDLSVDSVPALHEGQMVRRMRLFNLLDTGNPRTPELPENKGREGWFGKDGVPVYTLKQFRDVDQSNKACYQALVRVPHRVRVNEVLEVPRKAELCMHPIPMFPISEKLGLVYSTRTGEPYGKTRVTPVDRWFLLDVDIIMDNGVDLYSRIGMEWHEGPHASHYRNPHSDSQPDFADQGPAEFLHHWLLKFPSHPPPSFGVHHAP